MGFIPVEGQHYHNVASKIRMYLREFKGQDLEKAQSLLRGVIDEFNTPRCGPIQDVGVELNFKTIQRPKHHIIEGTRFIEYPDGTYEISVDMTKQEEE